MAVTAAQKVCPKCGVVLKVSWNGMAERICHGCGSPVEAAPATVPIEPPATVPIEPPATSPAGGVEKSPASGEPAGTATVPEPPPPARAAEEPASPPVASSPAPEPDPEQAPPSAPVPVPVPVPVIVARAEPAAAKAGPVWYGIHRDRIAGGLVTAVAAAALARWADMNGAMAVLLVAVTTAAALWARSRRSAGIAAVVTAALGLLAVHLGVLIVVSMLGVLCAVAAPAEGVRRWVYAAVETAVMVGLLAVIGAAATRSAGGLLAWASASWGVLAAAHALEQRRSARGG